jgi:hypothetical protein
MSDLEPVNSHERLQRVYRKMDKRIAQKIRQEPSLMEIARSNLKRWMDEEQSRGWPVSRALQEWDSILTTYSFEDIMRILEEDSEEHDRLNHSSPFPGILTEEERNWFLQHEL